MSTATHLLPLSENLAAIVDSAALPLRPSDRPLFLEEVGAELSRQPAIGPGVVFRIVKDIQRDISNRRRSLIEGPSGTLIRVVAALGCRAGMSAARAHRVVCARPRRLSNLCAAHR